jgi:hypothetical protein
MTESTKINYCSAKFWCLALNVTQMANCSNPDTGEPYFIHSVNVKHERCINLVGGQCFSVKARTEAMRRMISAVERNLR